MAAKQDIVLVPDKDDHYNRIFRYHWRTSVYALPQTVILKLKELCKNRWGYHFIPHNDMDWEARNWYERQTLYLTFENKEDLIQAKLSIDLK